MENPQDIKKIKTLKDFLIQHRKHNKTQFTMCICDEYWNFILCNDCQVGYFKEKLNFEE